MSEERTNMAIRDLKHYVIDNMSLDVQDDFEIICKYITNLQKKVEQQEKEIERLNNIINELEKYLKENIKLTKTAVHFEILDDYDTRKYKRDIALFEMVLDKLKELKDSD